MKKEMTPIINIILIPFFSWYYIISKVMRERGVKDEYSLFQEEFEDT
jgi:hypothetical protein